ncbi:MAG: SPOR domain-containing protein [Polaribacter sp.]
MKNHCIYFFTIFLMISCGKKEEKKDVLEVSEPKIEQIISEPVNVVDEVPELIFTVQIAASKLEKSRFSNVENVNIYNEDEYIKYRLGEYTTYKEARKNRAILRRIYNGAFVQALENGKPIHIKEALKN